MITIDKHAIKFNSDLFGATHVDMGLLKRIVDHNLDGEVLIEILDYEPQDLMNLYPLVESLGLFPNVENQNLKLGYLPKNIPRRILKYIIKQCHFNKILYTDTFIANIIDSTISATQIKYSLKLLVQTVLEEYDYDVDVDYCYVHSTCSPSWNWSALKIIPVPTTEFYNNNNNDIEQDQAQAFYITTCIDHSSDLLRMIEDTKEKGFTKLVVISNFITPYAMASLVLTDPFLAGVYTSDYLLVPGFEHEKVFFDFKF